MRAIILFLTVLLLIPLSGFAQITITNLVVYDEALEVLYAADLDLMQQSTGRELFSMTINNGGSSSSDYPNCTMEIKITKDGSAISEAYSQTFTIPAGAQDYQINNVELINNVFYFDPTDDATKIRFDHAKISDEVGGLTEELLATGKVPIGSYFLSVEIFYEGRLLASIKVILFLQATNPSFVQPLTPGGSVSFGAPTDVFTQYPMFQWTGNGKEYNVTVYERRPGLSSLDDIINSVPSWESERIEGFAIQYPAVQVVPLEYGRNYYWLVKMYVSTSAGEEATTSDIFQFRLVDPTNMDKGVARLVKLEIIEFLREFIGDKADEIAKKLEEYDLSKIYFNGEQISLDEIRRQLGSGKYKKDEVELVDLELR